MLKKKAAQARLSPHMSKCHIIGNHVSRLISVNVMLATFVTVPWSLFIGCNQY